MALKYVIIGLGLIIAIINSEALSMQARKDLAIKTHGNNVAISTQKGVSFVEQQQELQQGIENQIKALVIHNALSSGSIDSEDIKQMVKESILMLTKRLLKEISMPVFQECKQNEIALVAAKSSQAEGPNNQENDELNLDFLQVAEGEVMSEKTKQFLVNEGFFDALKDVGKGLLNTAGDFMKPLIQAIQKYLMKAIEKVGPALGKKIEAVIQSICEKAKQSIHKLESKL